MTLVAVSVQSILIISVATYACVQVLDDRVRFAAQAAVGASCRASKASWRTWETLVAAQVVSWIAVALSV